MTKKKTIKVASFRDGEVEVMPLHVTASGKLAVHYAIAQPKDMKDLVTITHVPTGFGVGMEWAITADSMYTLDGITALADRADGLDWNFDRPADLPPSTVDAFRKMRAQYQEDCAHRAVTVLAGLSAKE